MGMTYLNLTGNLGCASVSMSASSCRKPRKKRPVLLQCVRPGHDCTGEPPAVERNTISHLNHL